MKSKFKTHRQLGLIVISLTAAGLLPCAQAANQYFDTTAANNLTAGSAT